MKYLKLFEAYKSSSFTKIISFLKRGIATEMGYNDFISVIKLLLKNVDIRVSEITDEYFSYLPAKKALKVRGDKIKFWFSNEYGYLCTTRGNSLVNDEFNKIIPGNYYNYKLYREIRVGSINVSFDKLGDDMLDILNKFADFSFIFDINEAKKNGLDVSSLRNLRQENKKGSLFFKSSDEIKRENINRYEKILLNKYKFNTESDNILSIKKILLNTLGLNILRLMKTNWSNYTSKIDIIISNIIEIIKNVDRENVEKNVEEIENIIHEIKRYISVLYKIRNNKKINIELYRKKIIDEINIDDINKFELGWDKFIKTNRKVNQINNFLITKIKNYNVETILDFEVLLSKLSSIVDILGNNRFGLPIMYNKIVSELEYGDYYYAKDYIDNYTNDTFNYNDLIKFIEKIF